MAKVRQTRFHDVLFWVVIAFLICDQGWSFVSLIHSESSDVKQFGAQLGSAAFFFWLAIVCRERNKIAGGIAGALGTIGLLVGLAGLVTDKVAWPKAAYVVFGSILWILLGLTTLRNDEPHPEETDLE